MIRYIALAALLGFARATPGPACPACPPASGARCILRDSAGSRCYYNVSRIDGSIAELQLDVAGGGLLLACAPGSALDHSSLPAFPRLVTRSVRQTACAPPPTGYFQSLAALNVTARSLTLQQIPVQKPLTVDYFHSLDVETLTISAVQQSLILTYDALTPLFNLHSLHLNNVRLDWNETQRLPVTLVRLNAVGTGLRALTKALPDLPALEVLSLRDESLSEPPPLHAAPSLTYVSVDAPLKNLPSLERVRNATFSGVLNVTLQGGCDQLEMLDLRSSSAELPDGWLVRCGRLERLRLTEVPSAARIGVDLVAPGTLRDLTVTRCQLPELPRTLLAASPQLLRLDLSFNNITTLDSEDFVTLKELQELELSRNMLNCAALSALTTLRRLQRLRLAGAALGDCCDECHGCAVRPPGYSPLRELMSLQSLSLRGAGVTRMCLDWSTELRTLRSLDLRDNKITFLTARDLEWTSRADGGQAQLLLDGNPISALNLTREDYTRLSLAGATSAAVSVRLAVGDHPTALLCDCTAYWAARALRDHLLPTLNPTPRCQPDGRALLDMPDSAFTCTYPECSANCHCEWRAFDNTTVINCTNAGLTVLPVMSEFLSSAHIELILRNNNLTENVLKSTPLPRTLRLIDIRDNNLTTLSPTLAARLFTNGRQVQLAGNALHCECTTLRMAHRYALQIQDFKDVICDDNVLLQTKNADCKTMDVTQVIFFALAVTLALLIAVAIVARRAAILARIKATLRAFREDQYGDELEHEYDVFLVYSHHDEKVAATLVQELESGARPLRLCVHHRDWPGGALVAAAAARSVATSRCTLAVMSPKAARSYWPREELRLAAARARREGSQRLVMLVLGGEEAARGEPELRAAQAEARAAGATELPWPPGKGRASWWRLRAALPSPRRTPLPTRTLFDPHARPPAFSSTKPLQTD